MKKIMSIFIVLTLALMTIFTGCQNEDSKKKETKEEVKTEISKKDIKDTIVYSIVSEPSGMFNPLISNTTYDDKVNNLIYSSLIKYDENMNIVMDLAKNYTVSEDNLKISFELKDDLKWHDGKDLTLEDVKFTFKSLADKKYAGAFYSVAQNIKGAKEYKEGLKEDIEGIKIKDNEITFEFENIYAPAFTKIAGFPIIPKHIWENEDIASWNKNDSILKNPIGSGPYKFKEYKKGEFLKFERFENYHDGLCKTKNFILKITNPNTTMVELSSGDVDIADVSSLKNRDRDNLKVDGVEFISYPNRLFQYMGFNLRMDEFKNKDFRKVFMYAIDRKSMVDKLIEGNGSLVNAPIVNSSYAYPDEKELNQYEYDINKAKEILTSLNYKDSDNDGILEDEKGNKLSFVLKYPSGDKTRELIAPIIQSNLKDIGIEIKLSMMEFKTMMAEVVGNHEFELYLMGNNLDLDPDPKPYWHSTASSNEKGVYGWNIAYFRNEKADKLMEEGLKHMDINKRKEIYKDFAKLMNDELPWIYLFNQDKIIAYNKNLNNFKQSTYSDYINIKDWYILK